MREIFCTLALLLGAYLYLDRFLFGGGLGGLFLEGWRERLRLPSRRKETSAAQVPSSVPGADDLVETKVYVSGQRVPEGDKREETESKSDGDDTFALPEGKAAEDETTEWRDESFGRKITERYAPQRWEDPGFSGRFIQRDDGSGEVDILPVADPEQVRREVAASLQAVLDEQARDEFRPTEEELSELGNFDVDAFR